MQSKNPDNRGDKSSCDRSEAVNKVVIVNSLVIDNRLGILAESEFFKESKHCSCYLNISPGVRMGGISGDQFTVTVDYTCEVKDDKFIFFCLQRAVQRIIDSDNRLIERNSSEPLPGTIDIVSSLMRSIIFR